MSEKAREEGLTVFTDTLWELRTLHILVIVDTQLPPLCMLSVNSILARCVAL